MKRYKEEKYIHQRLLKSGEWSFQVIIRKNGTTIVESFNESEYGSARYAFDCAINYRNRKLTEIRDQRFFPASSVDLEQVFIESEDLANLNAKTKRNHATLFNNYIGNMKLDDFSTEFMIKKLNDISQSSSNDTISRVFSLFKQIDQTAVLKRYYPTPRCIAFKPPASKRIIKLKPGRTVDPDVVYSILKECKDKTIRGIILTACLTGMRPAEIFALTKSDIIDGFLYVNKQIGSDAENEGVVRNTKTDGSSRIIPLSDPLKIVFGAFTGPVLFESLNGGYFNANTFNARTARLFRPYGMTLYKCRHTFATTLEYAGVDRITIDALMGHSPRNSTDIYVHSNMDRMKDAMSKIGDQFGDHTRLL